MKPPGTAEATLPGPLGPEWARSGREGATAALPAAGAVMPGCNDPDRAVAFWKSLPGREARERLPGCAIPGRMGEKGPHLASQQVSEPKSVMNRRRLDLAAEDRDAPAARILEMGAQHVIDREMGGFRWTVMTNPEGNEFWLAPQRQGQRAALRQRPAAKLPL